MAVIQDPQTPKPIEQGEAPAAQEPKTAKSSSFQSIADQAVAPTLTLDLGKEGKIRVGSTEALTPFDELRLRNASNPHSVASYKMSSNGESEINGPLTWETFKQTDTYKKLKKDSPITVQVMQMNHDSQFMEELNQVINISSAQITDPRILIQSERDEKGEMKVKKIVMGHYIALGSTSGKQIHVDSVYNLENEQKIDIQQFGLSISLPTTTASALVIPLSAEGALLQPEVDKLVDRLHHLPLDIHYSNTTSDKKTTMKVMNVDRFRESDTYKTLSPEKKLEFDAQFATISSNGNAFTPVVAVQQDTAADKKVTTRVHMGHEKTSGALYAEEPLDRPAIFTKSFNVENGKTSPFEPPLTLQANSLGQVQQSGFDSFVEKVRTAVKEYKISRADVNPHFDVLLAKGPSTAGDDAGVIVPSTPMASDKKISQAV